jgi:hypothetical protein
MAAPRISPLPVPSFTHFRWNLPLRGQAHEQWKAVYRHTGQSQASQRVDRLLEKRRVDAAEKTFREVRERLLGQHAGSFATVNASTPVPGAVNHCAALNRYGLTDISAPLALDLARSGKLDTVAFADILESLAAPDVVTMLQQTETTFDLAEAMKRAADWSGNARARHAATLLDLAQASVAGGARAEHYNGLMAAYLTAGFNDASRVHGQVYDALGQHGVQPTARTYLLVMQALCLTGNPSEADSIFAYLKHRHAETVSLAMYETMLWGWLLDKQHDRVDAVWTELAQHRGALAPSIAAAETVMRSILTLAKTPLAEPHAQFGQWNHVERKRLVQFGETLPDHGIPANLLSRPMQIELHDAMRRFRLTGREYLQYTRAHHHFTFLDWRRRHNAIADVNEINPTVLHNRSSNAPGMAPAATAEVPSHLSTRPAWETMPLPETLNEMQQVEQLGRGRERWSMQVNSLQERGPNWMSEVPETRYDKLYGLSKPKMSKLGVRRQLLGDGPDADDVRAHDRKIIGNTLQRARRVRLSVDRARTHRADE